MMNIAEIYEQADIRALPADPVQAARAIGLKVIDYETAARYLNKDKATLYREDPLGFCFGEDGELCIAINSNACGKQRRRFSAAHELGHCVLGHMRAPHTMTADEERAADRFAAELLAPLAVLSACGIRTAEELARACAISAEAARIRLRQLAEYERAAGEASEEDVRIRERFADYIAAYRGCRRDILGLRI